MKISELQDYLERECIEKRKPDITYVVYHFTESNGKTEYVSCICFETVERLKKYLLYVKRHYLDLIETTNFNDVSDDELIITKKVDDEIIKDKFLIVEI